MQAGLGALIAGKKATLDALRHYYDVELTYTSNAIEGNTLTHQETALVIEKGIAIAGKSLVEHFEAQDHYDALRKMRELVVGQGAIAEADVLELHRRIVARSRPVSGAMYSQHPRRAAGSAVIFPAPAKIPDLMQKFAGWLATVPASMDTAFEARRRRASIHPFSDGNGRPARLLMKLVLVRGGLPPIAIGPEDRRQYLQVPGQTRGGGDAEPWPEFRGKRLEATLGDYIVACRQALPVDEAS